jgi:hypothetical protein
MIAGKTFPSYCCDLETYLERIHAICPGLGVVDAQDRVKSNICRERKISIGHKNRANVIFSIIENVRISIRGLEINDGDTGCFKDLA